MSEILSYNTKQRILIDEEDINYLSSFNWSIGKKGYVWSKINGKTTYMSRLIMGCPNRMTVDHINHDTLDNRKENLRICTYSENNYNRRSGSVNAFSKYKGVRKSCIKDKWRAEICYNGKCIYIGDFYTEEYAALMYNKEAIKTQKEYGHSNELIHSEQEIIDNERNKEIEHFKEIKKYSKYKYVSFDKKSNKWFGQKRIKNIKITTRRYDTEEEAHDNILLLIKSIQL
jgi:hypothetical protein